MRGGSFSSSNPNGVRGRAGLVVALVALAAACSSSGGSPSRAGSGGGAVVSSGGAPGNGGSGLSATGGQTSGSGGGLQSGSGGGRGGAAAGGSGNGGAGTGGATSHSDAAVGGPDDAARPDAGATDAGTPPIDGSSGGGCPGLFCEDFERGALDPNVWDLKTSSGQTMTVQKTQVAHGSYAAQFHALPNLLSYDLIITKNAPVGLRGHHFGRAYFYVTPMPPAQHTTFLLAGSPGFPKFKYLEVSGIQNQWQLTSVNLNGIDAGNRALAGGGETYSAPGGAIPLAQWICLEWEFNDAPDQIRVFVNGKQDHELTSIALAGVTSGQVGGFTEFAFGYYIWHPASYVFNVYYDDIVLDTKRIGCLP